MSRRAWLHPNTVTRQYAALLVAFVADMAQETRDSLKQLDGYEVGSSGWLTKLAELMGALALWHAYQAQKVIRRLPDAYAAVNRFNDKEFQAVVKAGTRLKIGPSSANDIPGRTDMVNNAPPRPSGSARPLALDGARPPGPPPMGPRVFGGGDMSPPGAIQSRLGYRVDVYRSEPWLAAKQEAWVAQNSALIKTVPQQYMGKVEALIRNAALQGLSSKELAKQIQEASGVTERRAKVIARDQVSKANAELTQYRQQDLGIKRYTWSTSHDERVRGTPGGRFSSAVPSHYARDKKQFDWANPPEGGHPGMAILCRCAALPVFPGEEEH